MSEIIIMPGKGHHHHSDVALGRKAREIGVQLALGRSAKTAAAILEIDVSTVYTRQAALRRLVGVRDNTQLLIWIQQNENCMLPGSRSPRGLHRQPCICGGWYCRWQAAIRAIAALDLDHAA